MRVEPASALVGHIAVPGDKSISHRAALLAAVGEGEVRIRNFGRSADTDATLDAVRALGAEVTADDDEVRVRGVGLRGLRAPAAAIDCANSGTLMRLLPGLLAGQTGEFTLTGDESLRTRPMERIAIPLREMGVEIETTDGLPPFTVRAGGAVHGITYKLPVASAQVKSAILLAGLYAEGETVVIEEKQTRDHTELMLRAAGVPVSVTPTTARVSAVERIDLGDVDVPGDFSSAAPFLVAATLLPGSELYVHGVGLNPRRTGLLDVLERMGARITIFNRRRSAGEAIGDIEVRSAPLTSGEVRASEVPRMIDELPLFGLAALHGRGESRVTGAAELRLKESDRIEGVVETLRGIGGRAWELEDGFRTVGVPARPRGGRVRSRGDHRLAILGAVAGVASRDGVEIEDAESVAVSFPGFFEMLEDVAQR
jgi:3-phosphoshikimate 1-carboxyvinyltransferase